MSDYNGFWYSPDAHAAAGLMPPRHRTGTLDEMYKGHVARWSLSEHSLYSERIHLEDERWVPMIKKTLRGLSFTLKRALRPQAFGARDKRLKGLR